MKDKIIQILKGSIITLSPNGVFIDKYRTGCACEEISRDLFDQMYNTSLIDMESGNWETRETHYHLNLKYISIENNIKYIKLEEIRKIIEENKDSYYVTDEFCDTFISLKIDIERNQKLKKIKDGILPYVANSFEEGS